MQRAPGWFVSAECHISARKAGSSEMKLVEPEFAETSWLHESFPHVRCFKSVWGWGMHVLGSMEPLEQLDAGQLAARMPESARRDLVEYDKTNAPALLGAVVRSEFTPESVLKDTTYQITDDRPFNEYFLLRKLRPELDKF
jgi:hypothetical protein